MSFSTLPYTSSNKSGLNIKKNAAMSSSRDSGFHSLEAENISHPGPGDAKLTIFMLGNTVIQNEIERLIILFQGKIYRWIVKAKLVALFSKSFMMGKPGEKIETVREERNQ